MRVGMEVGGRRQDIVYVCQFKMLNITVKMCSVCVYRGDGL